MINVSFNEPFPGVFQASLEILSSDYLDAVYDLTIAYSVANESPVPRKPAPSMTGKCDGKQTFLDCEFS